MPMQIAHLPLPDRPGGCRGRRLGWSRCCLSANLTGGSWGADNCPDPASTPACSDKGSKWLWSRTDCIPNKPRTLRRPWLLFLKTARISVAHFCFYFLFHVLGPLPGLSALLCGIHVPCTHLSGGIGWRYAPYSTPLALALEKSRSLSSAVAIRPTLLSSLLARGPPKPVPCPFPLNLLGPFPTWATSASSRDAMFHPFPILRPPTPRVIRPICIGTAPPIGVVTGMIRFVVVVARRLGTSECLAATFDEAHDFLPNLWATHAFRGQLQPAFQVLGAQVNGECDTQILPQRLAGRKCCTSPWAPRRKRSVAQSPRPLSIDGP